MFPEFYSNLGVADNKEEFTVKMLNLLNLLSIKAQFNDLTKLKLKRVENSNIWLDMGIINGAEFHSTLYTIFCFIWENVEKSNQIKILEAFTLLSNMYQEKNFSIHGAVEIPNRIVYNMISFELPSTIQTIE